MPVRPLGLAVAFVRPVHADPLRQPLGDEMLPGE